MIKFEKHCIKDSYRTCGDGGAHAKLFNLGQRSRKGGRRGCGTISREGSVLRRVSGQ